MDHAAFLNKFRKYVEEGEKPVSAVPGIGYMAAKKLKDLGYYKVKNLHLKLEKLNFNEQKLQYWAEALRLGRDFKVRTTYNALMKWHNQFGTFCQQLYDRGDANRDGRRMRKKARFDLSNIKRPTQLTLSQSSSDNHILPFYALLENTFSNILPELHSEWIIDTLYIARDYKKRSREKQNQPSFHFASYKCSITRKLYEKISN